MNDENKKECKFCYEYEFYKKYCDTDKTIKHDYTVAIVRRSWVNSKRNCRGRTVVFRNKGLGFKLNYCPECGKCFKKGGKNGLIEND